MPSDYHVRVANDVPYASMHNYGGETHPTVTPKMRRFAWAMYYNTSGIGKKPLRAKKRATGARIQPLHRLRCGKGSHSQRKRS